MDEESLRNRLLNRLKEQHQVTQNKDVEMESTPNPKKSGTRRAADSEISSGEMAESCEDNLVKKKGNKMHKVHKSKSKQHNKEQKGDKKEADKQKSTHGRSTPKPETNNTSSGKKENKINGGEINKKKERSKDKKQIQKVDSKSENKTPSPRSRHRRDTSPRQRYRRHRDRSNDSQQQRRRDRDSRYRSRSADRRRLSRPGDRYYRGDRRSPGRRDSRDTRYPPAFRSRRYNSRSRSRSINYSRSDSTTSFSISSYDSDMDTSVREKNVMPATSTTSGDKGMPAGFGQGLYLPQMNQPDRSKAGIGDLLSAIRQGQGQQSKSTAIAQYTAIFQQISAREFEQKDGNSTAGEATAGALEGTQAGSKFKLVEQEFPVSHGSEHRKATVDSETGPTGDQAEEPQPFTDPASINKMLLGIKPGKYIGDKVAVLPLSLLEGGDPAWVKKHQFKGLTPVRDGFGRKMMERMGWREGMPLGRSGYGAVTPLELDVKTDRKGLGVGSSYLPALPTNIPYTPGQTNSVVTSAESADPWSRVVEPNALAGGKHPVCVLMEICAKKHWHNPVFDEVGEQGPKYFKFKVTTSMGCFQPQHSSVNKKEAKRQAALACLQALGQVPANTVQFVSSSIPSTNIQRPHIPQPPPMPPQFPMSVPRQMPLPPLTLPPLHLPNAPSYLRPSLQPPGGAGHTPVYQQPYSF